MIKKILLFAVILGTICLAQEEKTTKSFSDSAKIKLFSPKLNSHQMVPDMFRSPVFSEMIKSEYFSFYEYRYAKPLPLKPGYIGQQNLNFALNQMHYFNKKGELGVIGQVLTIANTAAVGYLLYKHIEKYGIQ